MHGEAFWGALASGGGNGKGSSSCCGVPNATLLPIHRAAELVLPPFRSVMSFCCRFSVLCSCQESSILPQEVLSCLCPLQGALQRTPAVGHCSLQVDSTLIASVALAFFELEEQSSPWLLLILVLLLGEKPWGQLSALFV